MKFSKLKGAFPKLFDSVKLFSKLTGSQEPVEPAVKEPLCKKLGHVFLTQVNHHFSLD